MTVASQHDDVMRDRLRLIGMVTAGALVGFGIVLWVAANWSGFGKFGRFGLVGGVFWLSALVALALPRLRIPASLTGLLAMGGFLALVGQTYQSDADAWTLFALWGGLALPWAIGARHDSVWVLWVTVAFAAMSLWLTSIDSIVANQVSTALPVWAAAFGITLLLSPWAGISEWIGSTRWSFRLATVLSLILVVGHASQAVFVWTGPALLAYLGLLVLAATVAGFAFGRPFDLPLLAAATLALDILIILFLVKFFAPSYSNILSMLMLGLVCAGVVAGSGAAMLSVARGHQSNSDTDGTNAGVATDVADDQRSWPVVAVSAIGALIASVPLLLFLGSLFGKFIAKGFGTYVVGAVILAAAVTMLGRSRSLSFVQMLSIILTLVGAILIAFAFYRDLPFVVASFVMLALAISIAVVVPSRWIALLCGAAAAAFVLSMIMDVLGAWLFQVDGSRLLTPLLLVVGFGAAGLVGLAFSWHDKLAQVAGFDEVKIDGFAVGWTVTGLIALTVASGKTFLLAGVVKAGPGLWRSGVALDLSLTLPRLVAVALVVTSLAALFSRHVNLRTAVGLTLAGTLAIMSYLMPALGGAATVLIVAFMTGRRVLALLAAISVLWIVGTFYYWLGLTLLTKAYVAIGLGAAIGAAFLADWRGGDEPALATGTWNPPERGVASMITAALILVSAVALSGVAGTTISAKEAILSNGLKIYVALAPVDPRSLVQGDYMRLRFALPREPKKAERRYVTKRPVWAIATINSRDVATIAEYVPVGFQPSQSQLLLKVRHKGRRLMLATDSFFFEEGTGKRYEAAKFGEFRVDAKGYPILVGLADEHLRRIE